eukprot:TRINITY_DN10801_c0_g2_i1.p3 TRINITY_DN10801_c0_g2~~TRINITY_DN10801_c0_g2_i1.p3  ORF type:complete len:157 (+),score=0.01 TRINITY_DN10801_c0_g2_i1:63-533(+)
MLYRQTHIRYSFTSNFLWVTSYTSLSLRTNFAMLRNRFQVCKPQPLSTRLPKVVRKVALQRTFANLTTRINNNNNNNNNKYDYPTLPAQYDHSTNTMYWQSRPVTVVSRTMQILFHVAGFLTRTGLRLNRGGDDAVDLRIMLTSLGPAFVKIGKKS